VSFEDRGAIVFPSWSMVDLAIYATKWYTLKMKDKILKTSVFRRWTKKVELTDQTSIRVVYEIKKGRWIFLFGFSKNEKANLSITEIKQAVRQGELWEVSYEN
jgi:hypothetical protein